MIVCDDLCGCDVDKVAVDVTNVMISACVSYRVGFDSNRACLTFRRVRVTRNHRSHLQISNLIISKHNKC